MIDVVVPVAVVVGAPDPSFQGGKALQHQPPQPAARREGHDPHRRVDDLGEQVQAPHLVQRHQGGDPARGRRFSAQDLIAYAYLLLGVAIVLVPISWTMFSSIKPKEYVESFDTRILPYDQLKIEKDKQEKKPLIE